MTSAVATDIVVNILKNIIDKLDISVNKINNPARPHPFDTKKVEVDFSKKSIFMDFRGKKK